MLLVGSLCALSAYVPLMAGQLSLASPAFYLIGGYATGIVSVIWVNEGPDTGFWKLPLGFRTITFTGELYPWQLVLLQFVLGALASALFGLFVGLLALRLQGIYLALVTIGTVEILRIVVLQDQIGPFKGPIDPGDPSGLRHLGPFGGATGLPGQLRAEGMPQPVDWDWQYLLVVVPLLILCAFVVYRIERGRTGPALAAIREDELAASAIGIRPRYYKVMAFHRERRDRVVRRHALRPRPERLELPAGHLRTGHHHARGRGRRRLADVPRPHRRRHGDHRAVRAAAHGRRVDGVSTSVRDVLLNISPFVQGLVMVLVCVFLARGLVPPRVAEVLFPRDLGSPPPAPAADPSTPELVRS